MIPINVYNVYFFLALAPTAFQYATIVISKRLSTDEITTTGILNASASLLGILLISLMDTLENLNKKFTMELSNWVLFVILIGGFWMSFWISPTKDDRKDDRDGGDEEENTIINILFITSLFSFCECLKTIYIIKFLNY